MQQTILGISFFDGDVASLYAHTQEKGGLVVVPSGPGLAVDLRRSAEYREAVTAADVAVSDSGAMVLFWKLFRGKKIHRTSGLRLLQQVLADSSSKQNGGLFWVHPTSGQRATNEAWLTEQGLPVADEDAYLAPMYPKEGLTDEALYARLRERQPKIVILCIGGGVQERLGYWLRKRFKADGLPCPVILCTGAAIGFLSGNQVNIPDWADRMYLGWFMRCIYEPKTYVPRYWSAVPLAYLIARYGSKAPPLI